jgi:hypothetical protein
MGVATVGIVAATIWVAGGVSARGARHPSASPTSAALDAARPGSSGSTWYVSLAGNNTTGTSWATAWSEPANIDWRLIKPGDTILLDGGATPCTPGYDFTTTRPGVSCGMEYDTTLTVGASGARSAPITIRLASDPGHSGTAVLFGGRAEPLPYCHQTNYTGQIGEANGVLIGGYHNVVINGGNTSGIMVYGAVDGVNISSPSAYDITLERTEVFDNGDWSDSPGGGVYTDGRGILLGGGKNTTLRGDIVHDNGADEIGDAQRPRNSLNGLVIDTDWLYNRRGSPSQAGEPFNDLQAVGDNTCIHNDGIQLSYGGRRQHGLTVEQSLVGPLLNQGLYPGDSAFDSAWSRVTVSNSLMLAIRHNIITDTSVHTWRLDDDTLFAEQGGMEIPSNGRNAMTGVVKFNGYVYTPGWRGITQGNVWYLGEALPGSATNTNPNMIGPLPTATLNSYQAYEAANFTPQCSQCEGSSLHSLGDILPAIGLLSP